MAVPSSLGRLSLTCVSSLLPNGQRIPELSHYFSWLRIDREAIGERRHLAPDRRLNLTIALFAVLRKPVENFGDEFADFLKLPGLEAAGCPGGCAEPYA